MNPGKARRPDEAFGAYWRRRLRLWFVRLRIAELAKEVENSRKAAETAHWHEHDAANKLAQAKATQSLLLGTWSGPVVTMPTARRAPRVVVLRAPEPSPAPIGNVELVGAPVVPIRRGRQ